MARKNKKRKSFPKGSQTIPTVDASANAKRKAKERPPAGQPIRETVESLVIAFVLAFLFRTFQAEAFVIPTGSMAPTLMGRHKDVVCTESGERYKVNAASESRSAEQRNGFTPAQLACVGGASNSCRYPMLYTDKGVPPSLEPKIGKVDRQPSYNGDRILVNKYLYEFSEPKRWDVIVFKYPGDATTNYIKRLVGLPNEELRIKHGDVYVRPNGSDEDYQIATKPPRQMLAMRQLVHDTNHDSAYLHKAKWPLRWEREGWELETAVDGPRLLQTYSTDASGDAPAWLRYEHTPLSSEGWAAAKQDWREFAGRNAPDATPQLITDYNAYNTEVTRYDAGKNSILFISPLQLGLHWVSDLMIEAEVEIQSDSGQLWLDLVESGQHFRCKIDVATGEATLGVYRFETDEAVEGYSPKAQTSIRGAGRHRVRFANFDDQLTLWVDGSLVSFDAETAYDVDAVFGPDSDRLPESSDADAGDLQPVGLAAVGAKLTVSQLQVWRDLYYIADSHETPHQRLLNMPVVDFDITRALEVKNGRGDAAANVPLAEVCKDQGYWPALSGRRTVDFKTKEDQFFVMGDNSAASSDCRLWRKEKADGSHPAGPYLERSLLIGKAVCVYWPHSWLFPIPNVTDMRLVR